jgi:hypothetical protein
VNLYGFVGNDPVVWIDPHGLAKLWVYSGIRAHPFGPKDNYMTPIADDHPVHQGDRSDLSLVPDLLHPFSKWLLDLEANAKSNAFKGQFVKEAKSKKPECKVRIAVLMIAPKTSESNPSNEYCDVSFTVFWNPRDFIWNQGPGGKGESDHWTDLGESYPVKTNELTGNAPWGFFPEPGERLPTFRQKTVKQPWRSKPNPIPTKRWTPDGKTAPHPKSVLNNLMKNPNNNHVFLCHSQGCNLATQIIRKACSE